MKTKSYILLGLVAVALLLLAACSPEPVVQVETQVQTVEVPVEVPVTQVVTQVVEVTKEVEVVVTATPLPEDLPEGTLIIAIPTNIDTLDPGMGGQVHMMNCGYTAYEGLTFMNADGQIEPLLAESWEVEDDTTWLFHLRQGVTFHNGEPFNADAVVYTWKRIMEPGRVNRRTWETVEDIEVIDDYTVRITTKAPDPLLLLRMGVNTSGIYPPGYATEVGDEGVAQAPVGTSPFKFVQWVRGEKVVFEAWPDYWGGPATVGVQTLVWRTIPEADSRLAALEVGEVDIALQIPPSLIDLVADNPSLRLARALGTRTFYLLFDNVSTGIGTPLEDQQVRLAMIHAVDRQAIVDAVFRGNGKVLATTVGPTQFGWDPSFEPLPYDPEKARQLLAEAGYPDGFKTSMACPSGAYPNDVEACQAIVGYLRQVGIDVDLNVRDGTLHWDLWLKRQTDPLVFDGQGDRFGDAQMNGGIYKTTSAWNLWADEGIHDLLIAGESTVDVQKRKEIYFELQTKLQEDPPLIPLWQTYNFCGLSNRVDGFVVQPTENMDLRTVRLFK